MGMTRLNVFGAVFLMVLVSMVPAGKMFSSFCFYRISFGPCHNFIQALSGAIFPIFSFLLSVL